MTQLYFKRHFSCFHALSDPRGRGIVYWIREFQSVVEAILVDCHLGASGFESLVG